MAFIVKGNVFKPPEEIVTPQVVDVVVAQKEEIKKESFEIKLPPPPKVKVVVEKYKHIHDGELHRLINKKSGYICDMFDSEEP